MTDTYPLIRVSGAPYEMGVQHGEQARDRVRNFVEMILSDVVKDGVTREDVMGRTAAFRPLFDASVPDLMDEVRGLADGAGLTNEEALLLQIRGEIGQVCQEACTTFAISGAGTADGRILIGQNSDMDPRQEEVGIVLHVVPDHVDVRRSIDSDAHLSLGAANYSDDCFTVDDERFITTSCQYKSTHP